VIRDFSYQEFLSLPRPEAREKLDQGVTLSLVSPLKEPGNLFEVLKLLNRIITLRECNAREASRFENSFFVMHPENIIFEVGQYRLMSLQA
jgi:hypothetical protein